MSCPSEQQEQQQPGDTFKPQLGAQAQITVFDNSLVGQFSNAFKLFKLSGAVWTETPNTRYVFRWNALRRLCKATAAEIKWSDECFSNAPDG